MLLSPLFAWLWPALERKNINPSKPLKTALGLLFAAFAFGVLSLSTTYLDDNGLAGFWWFVLAYLLLEIGEMLLSPISLAAVTALSVPNVVSVMMGGWFLGTSYAEVLAAELGKLSSITIPDGEVLNIAEALSKYDQLFQYSMWVGFIAFAVMLMLTPILKRGMHGVK